MERTAPASGASSRSASPEWARAFRPPWSATGGIAAAVDRALAFRIDPRETLVVSGFWRSGTTWLQETLRDVLRAKTLFEPLCPLAPGMRRVHRASGMGRESFESLRLFMPYCGTPTLEGPLRDVFRGFLRAEVGGSWVRRFRTGLTECLRPRVVVKLVTAPLCLRAAQETFGMPAVHVTRDPRAIVASIRKTRWTWLFDHLSLAGQLLAEGDGRTVAFDRFRDEILEYDRAGTVERVVAYWALTETVLLESYAGYGGRVVFASYESLAREREPAFSAMLAGVGLRPADPGFRIQDRDSATTSEAQRGATVGERVGGWRSVLSVAEVETIERITRRFGLGERLVG